MGVIPHEFIESVNAAQGKTGEIYAVIVGDAQFQTVRQTKGWNHRGRLVDVFPPFEARRYKIALQSTPSTATYESLPWAWPTYNVPLNQGGFVLPEGILAKGTLVIVEQRIDSNLAIPTGDYHIVQVIPNAVRPRVDTNTRNSVRSAYENNSFGGFSGFGSYNVVPENYLSSSGMFDSSGELASWPITSAFDESWFNTKEVLIAESKKCKENVNKINQPLEDLSKALTKAQQKLVGTWDSKLQQGTVYTTKDPEGQTWVNNGGAGWKQASGGTGGTVNGVPTPVKNVQWGSLSPGANGAPGGVIQNTSSILATKNALDNLQKDLRLTAKDISKFLAKQIRDLAEKILKRITAIINKTSGVAPGAARFLVDEKKNTALDIISCLILKMLKNLENIIFNALFSLMEKVVNFGSCVLETFLSQFLGQLLGQLLNLINAILRPISQLLGSIISFTDAFFDVLQSIIDFLKCDPDIVCPKIGEWSFINGAKAPRDMLDLESVFTAASNVASSFSNVMNIPDNIEDYEFDFNIGQAVDDAVDNCDVGPIACGPPNVVFWGGGGSGATGNPVISAVGDLMGVDIITPGKDYTSSPAIAFEDNCGNGNGGVGDVGIGTVVGVGLTTGVLNVTIVESGYGYLPSRDGSTGGSGRTYADRCQTIIKRSNGNWDPAYSEGTVLTVYWWDMVQLPGKGEVYIDKDFTIDMLPGWTEHGTRPDIKSMVGFDDCRGTSEINPLNIQSMVGFDDTRGSSSHPEVTPPISDEHAQYVEEFKASLISQGVWDHYRQFDVHSTGYGVPNQFGFVNDYHYARELGYSDKDIRFYLEGFYSQLLGKNIGPLMRAKLDDPDFGPLPPYYTAAGNCGVFDCETDYPYAQSLGFTDEDIRFYLEKQYSGTISECMQSKLDDPSWGPLPDYYVTGTAPGCPPLAEGPTYPVIASLDDIVTIDCGFGYDCANDTVSIVPSHGAEAVVEQCDENGAVCKLRVTNAGVGFTMLPEITINSTTGYNGRYLPRLKFERPSEIPPGTEVLQVIDCVGRVVNCGC